MSDTAPKDTIVAGGKHRVTVKALKRVLKKNGLKTTGKKATLTRRAKKARLMGGRTPGVVSQLVRAPVKAIGIAAKVASAVVGRTRRRRY